MKSSHPKMRDYCYYNGRPLRAEGTALHGNNPSFSSTLLDKIYRSIDGGETKVQEPPDFRDNPGIQKKQHRPSEEKDGVGGNVFRLQMQGSCFFREMERKHHSRDVDQDSAYFSSTSISSDSSSGGFSSSDTESLHGPKARASCFAPLKLRPVKTHAVPAKTEKTEYGGGPALFCGNREGGVVSKSRALKVYETLKKVKQQPVSPGGRLTSLLNSIFASSSKKKGCPKDDANFERKAKSGQALTCSSASSFSRSLLNSNSRSATGSSGEDARNGEGKRSVRFGAVNVMVGEDRRPHGRTFPYYESEGEKNSGSCRITRENFGELKKQWEEEEVVNRKWTQEIRYLEGITKELSRTNEVTRKGADEVESSDDDDGAGSCSSSDLFEIDHMAMVGDDDGDHGDAGLPVYGGDPC